MSNFERVIEFMKQFTECDLTDATPDSQLIADLGLNSLELIELVNDAEDAFDIIIEDDDFVNIVTLGDVAALLS